MLTLAFNSIYLNVIILHFNDNTHYIWHYFTMLDFYNYWNVMFLNNNQHFNILFFNFPIFICM